jgi:hypothetical protein
MQIVERQRSAYQEQRANLKMGELFVTGDFGVHPVHGANGKLPTLVLVCHYLDESLDLMHCFMDCVPMDEQPQESKDWCYVRSCFMELFRAGFFAPFHKIIWWSDTGPNHFRTSNTIFFLRFFQETAKIEVVVNFFAPYHGHSMCDGHIGAVAQSLRYNAARAPSLAIWTKSWVLERMEALKHTDVVHVPIMRPEKVVCCLKGIKAYLGFSFRNDVPESVECFRFARDAPVQRKFERLSSAVAAAAEADDE